MSSGRVAVAVGIGCAPRGTPAKGTAAAPAYQDPCTEEGLKEQECPLPDGRHGWCGARKCDDICGPNATYTHVSSSCVKPCGADCTSCNRDFAFCVDESPYGSQLPPTPR